MFALKFCTGFGTVVACAKFCSDMIPYKKVSLKQNFHHTWITMAKLFMKWPWSDSKVFESSYQCRKSNLIIRQSWDYHISTMGIPRLVRQHLYFEWTPQHNGWLYADLDWKCWLWYLNLNLFLEIQLIVSSHQCNADLIPTRWHAITCATDHLVTWQICASLDFNILMNHF